MNQHKGTPQRWHWRPPLHYRAQKRANSPRAEVKWPPWSRVWGGPRWGQLRPVSASGQHHSAEGKLHLPWSQQPHVVCGTCFSHRHTEEQYLEWCFSLLPQWQPTTGVTGLRDHSHCKWCCWHLLRIWPCEGRA